MFVRDVHKQNIHVVKPPKKWGVGFCYFVDFFYFMCYRCFAYIYDMCVPGVSPWNCSYRRLWATMYGLGIELRSSRKAASTSDHWAISPAQIMQKNDFSVEA